jgi:hypothetical protein
VKFGFVICNPSFYRSNGRKGIWIQVISWLYYIWIYVVKRHRHIFCSTPLKRFSVLKLAVEGLKKKFQAIGRNLDNICTPALRSGLAVVGLSS